MGNWKDKADDIVIIYILLLAVLFVLAGALLLIPTIGCSIIIIVPGALIIWAALRHEYWFLEEPRDKYLKDYPYAQYPPPRSTQPEDDYYKLTKRLYRKLDMPSVKTLLIIFLGAIGIGAVVLLTIETWFGVFASVPFIFVFVIAFSFPSFIWISFVYSKDIFTPEPARNIMIALTWGMLSVIPAVIGEIILGVFWAVLGFSAAILTLLSATIDAPFVEESCKPFGLTLLKTDIHTKLDGLIYGVTAGMGFAMVENLMYEFSVIVGPIAEFFVDPTPPGDLAVTVSSSWAFTSLIRGLGSTIGHAVGAGMIGMAYFQYRNSEDKSLIPLMGAFAFAVTLHMTWNGTLSILELQGFGDLYAIPFVISFPIVELFILKYLIRQCRLEEPEIPLRRDESDLFNLPPPPSPYYLTMPPTPPAPLPPQDRGGVHTHPRSPHPPQRPRSPPPPPPPHLAHSYPYYYSSRWTEEIRKNRTVRCPFCHRDSIIPPPEYGKYMVCPHCHRTFQHPY